MGAYIKKKVNIIESVTIKYGTEVVMETKEEAINRILKRVKRKEVQGTDSIIAKWFAEYNRNRYSETGELSVSDKKLLITTYYHEYLLRSVSPYSEEAPDVMDAVEERLVPEILAEENRQKAKAEEKARIEQERKDAVKKKKYLAWKAEAERLDIPFVDFCAMKRAEMEEYLMDDDD